MNREELVRRLVLNSICDDYENIDQIILRQVAEMGAKMGLKIERPEVVVALAGLIDGGFAKMYQFSARKAVELQDMPSMEIIEEDFKTYFYITKAGMDLHLSDNTWWPFDDEGKPRG